MKERTLTALKESIQKWERRAAGDHNGKLGVNGCPLCQIHNVSYNVEKNCLGCPVFERTGKRHCIDTPYYTYARGDRTDANAQAEVDFLKSLLPIAAPLKEKEEEKKEEFNWTELNYLEKKEKDIWT